MKTKQRSIILKRFKTKEIEEILGLKFDEKGILNNADEYIKNAISTGSAQVLEFTLSKIKEVRSDFCIRDEALAKNILVKVLQTGNSELLQECLDEVIDPKIDILNKQLKNTDNIIFRKIPKTMRYVEPLTFVLLNDFLSQEETEDLAIGIIEKGAYIGNIDKRTEMATSLKFAIKGLYPKVVKKLIDCEVKLPDIVDNDIVVKEVDMAQGGQRKLRHRANLIKHYITQEQLDRYLTNVVGEEKKQVIENSKEFKNLLKDMLTSKFIKKKNENVIRKIINQFTDDCKVETYLRSIIAEEKLDGTENMEELEKLALDEVSKNTLEDRDQEVVMEILEEREQRRLVEKILTLTAIKTRNINTIKTVLEQTKKPDIKLKVVAEDEVFEGLFNELEVSRFEEVTPLVLVLAQDDISTEAKEEIALSLIKEFGADIGVENKEYATTLLNLALKKGANNVAKEIFENTKAVPDISNENFNKVIEEKKIVPVAISLTEIRDKQLKMHLKERFTQEQIEKIMNNEELKKFFTDLSYKEFDSFLENIDKVDMKEFGEYMLERALMSQNVDNIEAVLERGVDVDMPLTVNNDIDYDQTREVGNTQVTPMMFVISADTITRAKKEEIVEFLISKGADINKTYDVSGMSAIQYASCNLLRNTVKEFVKLGVSLNSMDEIGMTSIGYARHCLTDEEKEKILLFALKKREQRIYEDIQKEIECAIEDRDMTAKEFVSKLLDLRTESKTNYNDVKLLGHIYSLDGKQMVKGNEIEFEGWDGGGYPILNRIDMLFKLARDIKYNDYGKHMMSKISDDNLMDIIKSEILNEFYVINGAFNTKDAFILEGYSLKKHNQNIAKVYADKIKSLKKNETFSLYTGTKGHAIYMVFERMANGKIQAARYNLGQGSSYHTVSDDNKIKPYKVELPEGEEGLEFFIKNVLDWGRINISTRPQQYKEELLEFFETIGGKRIDDGIAMKAQTVGNCSLKSDTAARVGRVLQRLKIQNEELAKESEEKLKDLAKNICRFIKNYERECARNAIEKGKILTQQEINKKIEENTIKRYMDILDKFIYEKYESEFYEGKQREDAKRELNKIKREMINFLEKRTNIKLDEETRHKEEYLDENILKLMDNLEDKIEYIEKIKKMSQIIYMNIKRDVVAREQGISPEEVVL